MPKFQQRHYEAIAETMQQTYSDDSGDGGGADTWSFIVESLADMFASDSPKFQRDRFIRACEPGANVKART